MAAIAEKVAAIADHIAAALIDTDYSFCK